MAAAVGREPTGLDLMKRQRQPLDRFLGGGDLGGAHLREVFLPQHLLIGRGQPRRDLAFALLAPEPVFGVGEQGLLHARGGGLRCRCRRARRDRRHQRQELFEIAAPLEEDMERLVEHERMFVALHKDRVQRPVEILARGQAGGLDRVERIDRRARPDRQPCPPQRAGEIDNVVGEASRSVCHVRYFSPAPTLRTARVQDGDDRGCR